MQQSENEENKPHDQKTWQNIKTFISKEYAKENKQNKLTAKNFKANMIEEQAKATEELIAALTKKHTQQIEMLIKNNTKEPSSQTNEEKKKSQEERCKKYNDAPVCKNCGKKHPTKKEDECWELKKNKDSRPSNWKSAKST